MNDLISRQAAIDVLKQLQKNISADYSELDPLVMAGCGYIGDCIGELECLPPAESEILSEFKSTLFGIGEICVDVSKWHITAEEGIQQIRDKYLDVMYIKVAQMARCMRKHDSANAEVITEVEE